MRIAMPAKEHPCPVRKICLQHFQILALISAFSICAYSQTFTILANLSQSTGGGPGYVSLAQGTDGDFYATTEYAGSRYHGTVFRVSRSGQIESLHTFCQEFPSCSDGSIPMAGVILGTDGTLYGTAGGGLTEPGCYGDKCGTIFKVAQDGTFVTVYSFCSQPGCPDGWGPVAALVRADDGDLYGTTESGACPDYFNFDAGCGTIFKITPSGELATLHIFPPTAPVVTSDLRPLIQASDGNFYGTAADLGWTNRCPACGIVFRFSRDGRFDTLHIFEVADGCYPMGGVIEASDGNLYGTTTDCGAGFGPWGGTIFRISKQGEFTTLYNFCSLQNCTDGGYPNKLIQASDGNLYGVTLYGGPGNNGTIFRITTGGQLTTMFTFDGSGATGGGWGLLQATDGKLYGTAGSTTNDYGLVYSFDVGLAPFVSLERHSGKVGQSGGILGQGFTGATSVELNGTPAQFTVVSDTFIRATVPPGAQSGYVTVTTPTGTLNSDKPFQLIP
jgi:uncharacterized repeat protein (TIGR03803 family)